MLTSGDSFKNGLVLHGPLLDVHLPKVPFEAVLILVDTTNISGSLRYYFSQAYH